MKEQPPLYIRLSAEELLLILWLLNTPTLPGMGGTPFAGWTEREIAAALSSAERSLRARRLVSKAPQGNIQMDEVVMALVGTCAVAEFSVVVTSESPESGRWVHYFHATQLMAVEHSNPEPGVHVFEALEEGQDGILRRLGEIIHLDQQTAPSAEAVKTTLDVLRRATEAAQESPEGALQVLLESEIERTTAKSLADSLAQVRRRSAVAAIHPLREEEPRSDGFVILEGPDGFWGMQIQGDDSQAIVRLWPRSALQIRHHLRELVLGQPLNFDNQKPG